MRNIYLGWIAYNNDPYPWARNESLWADPEKRFGDESRMGPTLSFMTMSKFKGSIDEVHLLAQQDPHSKEIVSLLQNELKDYKVTPHWLEIDCVIDHQEVYDKMMVVVPSIIDKFDRERVRFLINVSPGTPVMQFVWLLMTQAGRGMFDPHEIAVFQGNPPQHRKCMDDPNEVLRQIDLTIPTLMNLARAPFTKAHQGLDTPGRATQDKDEKVISPAQIYCRDLMRKAAAFDFPVTLLGERGVGKTTNAKKWIHMQSNRREGPFEEVVSGGYPDEAAMKYEMFGWKEGSFTGAMKDYDGAIKRANGGTLFFDEIADLSKPLQRLLIRAIESKRFLPMGACEHEESDFRLVCATNKSKPDLHKLLDDDFYDRMIRNTITIPALRKRKEDIPHLWLDTCRSMIISSNCQIEVQDGVHDHVVDQLVQMNLPGNFRNLMYLAEMMIRDSYKEGAEVFVVTMQIAQRALASLAEEESQDQSIDVLLGKLVEDWHASEQWKSAAKEKGFFGDFMKRQILDVFIERYRKTFGKEPTRRVIEEVLGLSSYSQDVLRNLK